MLFKERKEFSFVSKALPEDTFSVVKFSGTESISRPFEFDITLSSGDPEIDLKTVLQNPATLTVTHGDEELSFHGVLARFEQLHEVKQHAFYRAVLVSKLWNAGLYRENQIFLDKTVPQVIEETLKQAGIAGNEYELHLTRSYPGWEHICQYQETDFDFISRWMEREGIYYFFEQSEEGAKMVISDNLSIHKEIQGDTAIAYSPPSGLIPSEKEIIREFACRQRMLPARVVLKDYNYRKPGLEVKAEAEVDPKGRGEVYIYEEHFKDPDQGKELAKIRAEELLCREVEFHGEGTDPAFSPGFLFELTGHYRSDYNRKYLIVEVSHEGSRSEDLLAGLGNGKSEKEEEAGYSNRFVCIPADVQFRPQRRTPKPKFYGTMNAFVDAAGDGKYAELDDQGRYKVILPFDLSGRKDGKASRFIRMAQPYSGHTASDGLKKPSGMHFPLHKGAEVLLTFVDGDPDRPIISSAIPNPETTSPAVNVNQTQSVIRDYYGNELVFDATPGDEHIRLHSPHHNSRLELGRSWGGVTTSDHNEFKGGSTAAMGLGNKYEAFFGNSFEAAGGMLTEIKLGLNYELALAAKYGFHLGTDAGMHIGPEFKWHIGPIIERTMEDAVNTAEGNSIISAEKTLNLVGAAGENKEGNTSIMEATSKFIRLSVGNNKSPVQNSDLEDKKIEFMAGSIVTGGIAAAMAGMIGLLNEKMDTVEGKALSAGLGSMFGTIETACILTNVLYLTFVGMKGYKESVKPISHYDVPAEDIIDSHLELSKEGSLRLGVREHNARAKDKCLIHLDRKNDGRALMRSKESKFDINSNGNVFAVADKDLNLESKKGNVFIKAKGKQVQIKCSTLYGPSRNLVVLK